MRNDYSYFAKTLVSGELEQGARQRVNIAKALTALVRHLDVRANALQLCVLEVGKKSLAPKLRC